MSNDLLKVFSLNARGLNDYNKRTILYDWLQDLDIDIVLLQETHYVESKEYMYNARWRGHSYHCFSNSSSSRGVSVLIRNGFSFDFCNYHRSSDGRKILLNIKINDILYSIVNLYAPNKIGDRKAFFTTTNSWVRKFALSKENLLVCGDFNCKLDEKHHCFDTSISKLNSIIKRCRLVDSWIHLNESKVGYTWCNAQHIPSSRIDYIFISDNFSLSIDSMTLRNCPQVKNNRMSDHLGLRIDFILSKLKRGNGYWKMNTSNLLDREYNINLRKFLKEKEIEINELNCPHERWETIKHVIKEFSIEFSKKKSRSLKNNVIDIENKIKQIEEMPYNEINHTKKQSLEKELNEIYERKSKGAYIRSRANWIRYGDKCTSYFLNLEKKHQKNNVIEKIGENDKYVYNNNDILGALCNFYEQLYTSQNPDQGEISKYISNTNISSKLTEHEKQICEDIPTLKECEEAIKSMKNNKSPGNDGIPVEFYKLFWNDIKSYFYKSLLKSFEIEELCTTQKLSLISLIHKKGDKSNIKNYRPISLTNCDYKILAFILARRLQGVISKLINNDQSAYIKGRYIGCNARLIQDIFDYCEDQNEDGVLLFLDFEKAFDTVEWTFMFDTLKMLNFGPNFIKWIRILYKNPTFRVKNNGFISKSCNMTRGIRQGCPISALLFILTTEILASRINSSKDINGFKTGNNEIRMLQHADDSTNTLKDINSVRHVIDIVNKFSVVAGPKLNIQKSECMLLGPLKKCV